MKYSYRWLKEYIPSLPRPEKLADVLNAHAFEVESIERHGNNSVLEIKILNRAADCSGHMGMAHEIAAILDVRNKTESRALADFLEFRKLNPGKIFREIFANSIGRTSKGAQAPLREFGVVVEDPNACPRYLAYRIDGVVMKKSPPWLRRHLEPLGVNSINLLVDLAHFIMLKTGQPTHIFDADKIEGKNIVIRRAKTGERMTTLDGVDVALGPSVLVIADSQGPLAIAGIKGGKRAEVTKHTKNIMIESANFESVIVRSASRILKISTDASVRFSQGLDPHLTEYATGLLVRWILEYAGGTPKGYNDFYPKPQYPRKIALRLEKLERVLGIQVSQAQLLDILRRLDFKVGFIASPRDVLVKNAKKLLGSPYKYGASTMYDAPYRFDCSSFIQYVFRHIGVQLPRMSFQQYTASIPVADHDILPGDLIFRSQHAPRRGVGGNQKKFGHVGLFVGDGKVIHAASDRKQVVVDTITQFKKVAQYQGARRVLARETTLHFVVEVPTARKDLLIEEDLIEEVGRLLGYYRIPARPLAESFSLLPLDQGRVWKEKICDVLAQAGFYETDTYNFIGSRGREALGDTTKDYWELENPIRSELSFLRRSLVVSLAEVVAHNAPRHDTLRFFEIGNVFIPEKMKGDPIEAEEARIGGIVWHASNREKSPAFYEAKGTLTSILESAGISDFVFTAPRAESLLLYLHPHRSAIIRCGAEDIGFVGAMHPQTQRELGIKRGEAVVFEISFPKFVARAESEIEYQEPSKYPSVVRDVSILVSEDVRVQEVEDVIENTAGALLWETDLFDLFDGENIETGRHSMAFHLVFQSNERTLRDEEVDAVVAKVIAALESKGWEVRA